MAQEIQGEVLFEGIAGGSGNPDEWVYTPWQPAQGPAGVFSVEVLDIAGLTLKWNAQTKNSETADDAAEDLFAPTSAPTATSIGVTRAGSGQSVTFQSGTQCLELVRFKFSTGGTASTDSVLFRPLPIAWQPN